MQNFHAWVKPALRAEKPIVTAVNGVAAGAGFALSLLGDVALAATDILLVWGRGLSSAPVGDLDATESSNRASLISAPQSTTGRSAVLTPEQMTASNIQAGRPRVVLLGSFT